MQPVQQNVIRYYGSKFRLAPWIISHFPAHDEYVDLCGGAAGVLLQKPPSKLETYNDLDGNIVNLFRVIRDKQSKLARAIAHTPWSRGELEFCREHYNDDGISDVERARRFLCYHEFRINAGSKTSGFSASSRHDSTYQPAAVTFKNSVRLLRNVSERLKHVQFECRDYRYIMSRYGGPETLVYFDPPYVASTRAHTDAYFQEWSDDDHREAAKIMRESQSMIVVSGYACKLYQEEYEDHGWERYDTVARTNGGTDRIESLWLSPKANNRLNNIFTGGLFSFLHE